MSGIFFKGLPGVIVDAVSAGRLEVVTSLAILKEYYEVARELSATYPIEAIPLVEQIALRSEILDIPGWEEHVCDDSDDDKFLACALAAGVRYIISGDKALLRVSGYQGVHILTPREFVQRFM
jgi:putative PIN family toxin of toxin-antitoxin system